MSLFVSPVCACGLVKLFTVCCGVPSHRLQQSGEGCDGRFTGIMSDTSKLEHVFNSWKCLEVRVLLERRSHFNPDICAADAAPRGQTFQRWRCAFCAQLLLYRGSTTPSSPNTVQTQHNLLKEPAEAMSLGGEWLNEVPH